VEGGPVGDVAPGAQPGTKRRYDSPVRREQAVRTRERIADAGVALARELPTWDWQGLTFAAVAARAGVGVRTVYRYFPTERDLHDAIMGRLQQAVGGGAYEGLTLADLGRAAARLHASLPAFAVSRWGEEIPEQPTLLEVDRRRRDAVLAAVADTAPGWTEGERAMAAAVLDVLWGVSPYERLTTAWNFEGPQATMALTWAIGIIVDAIQGGRRPGGGLRLDDHSAAAGGDGQGSPG
jgi:AcrR family transcriptional regulator